MQRGTSDTRMKNQEPRASASCAACKFLKRRCAPNCLFAPYFHADEPKKFAKVHKVFGASNISKILNEVAEDQREETVNSLVYEAELRLQDPVYGCIGAIASLQQKMVELQNDLILARARLACYIEQQHQQQQQQLQMQQEQEQQDMTNLFVENMDNHVSMDPYVDITQTSVSMVDPFEHDVMPFDQFNPFQFPQ